MIIFIFIKFQNINPKPSVNLNLTFKFTNKCFNEYIFMFYDDILFCAEIKAKQLLPSYDLKDNKYKNTFILSCSKFSNNCKILMIIN